MDLLGGYIEMPPWLFGIFKRKNDRSWLGPDPRTVRETRDQGFELSLGKRVVIRHLRPAQRAGHAEVSEKPSGVARHWSSPIRVQQEAGLDAMLQAALLDNRPARAEFSRSATIQPTT